MINDLKETIRNLVARLDEQDSRIQAVSEQLQISEARQLVVREP